MTALRRSTRLALAAGVLLAPACGLCATQNARTALHTTHVLCLIAHAETDDATVARICGIEEALYPDMQQILNEQRAASRRFAAARAAVVTSDAGAP